jgi:hypothetical protein
MRYPAGFISAFYNPLKNPDAPTIGTATAGGSSASVAFTAPSNVGGSAITSFTAISTPSGITASSASSPITVSGLTNGTAYTFKVLATNSYGSSVLSAASNSVTPVMQVGDAYAGGYYAGQISTAGNGVADYNLVIGPKSTTDSSGKAFNSLNTTDSGATSVINGPSNSASMNDANHPAAQFCEALTVGGFTDWYMPAKNEIEVCYYNLKPTATNNETSSGINANAVPARASNYQDQVPAQTSATLFIDPTGAQAFNAGTVYWNSTEFSATKAYTTDFNNGRSSGTYARITKSYGLRVRAVRRVAV